MDSISLYMGLMNERPDLFVQSDKVTLVLKENEIRKYSEDTGKSVGVVFDNSPFYMVIADVCKGKNGLYRYSRVIYTNPKSNGCIAVPYCNGRFGLLKIFRHAPRVESVEFPRGFSETANLTLEENMKKEMSEEMNVSPEQCEVSYLGSLRADTGLSSGLAQVFKVEIAKNAPTSAAEDEGIMGMIWVEEEELRQMISTGEIRDGYTLSAYTLFQCKNQ